MSVCLDRHRTRIPVYSPFLSVTQRRILTLESSIYIIYKVKEYRGDVMVSYIVRGARSGEVQVALVPAIPGYNEGRKLSQRVSQRLWITAEWLSQGFWHLVPFLLKQWRIWSVLGSYL